VIPVLLAAALFGSAPRMPEDPVSQVLMHELAKGLPPAAVGQWVTYRLDGGMNRVAYWRLSVVGKQRDREGRNAVWVEMELSQTAKMVAPLFQMRLLVATREGLQADGISRVIVAAGVEKPQELDAKSVQRLNEKKPAAVAPNPEAERIRADVHLRAGKAKKLMTLAGTLDAVPVEMLYRDTVVERFWMSRQVPVLQLAKIEMPAIDQTMEVRDYGLDARPMMRPPDPSAPKLSLDPTPGGPDALTQAP
jgi:hypothetical protein